MDTQPQLSIIIVNWHSAEYLRACLASIFTGECDFSFEVVVIDNGSYDGCGEMLRKEFPQVCFLQAPHNLGFAEGNNSAFAFSAGRNLLFLNPDTEVVGPALRRMTDVLVSTPDAGIVGPRLVGPDFRVQRNCMRCLPTILNQVLDASLSRKIVPKWWGLDVVARKSHQAAVAEVVPGTCLMVRREVFVEAGLFNPAYFLYAEDVDLCCKARKLGWKTYYLDDAMVIHHGGRSSQLQHDGCYSAVLMRESVRRFLITNRGRAYAFVFRAATGAAAFCRVLACGGFWLLATPPSRQLWRAAANKWTRVLRWSLGREAWAEALGGRQSSAASSLQVRRAESPQQQLRA